MANVGLQGTYKPKDDKLDAMFSTVDHFVKDDISKEDPGSFWKRIFRNTDTQQQYAKCLIYKYISFTYGLGNEPLREAVAMINNITSHPNPTSKVSMDPQKAKDSNKLGNPEISPFHKRALGPANTGRRWTSGDMRVLQTKRDSFATVDNTSSQQHGKVKRKSSGNTLEDNQLNPQSKNTAQDSNDITKLRDIIFTLSYLVQNCEVDQWDFNSLRDVFLVWTKARGWEQTASAFEQAVMKKFSKPPNSYDDIEEKLENEIQDILHCYHTNLEGDSNNFKTLNQKIAGNSTKYASLRQKVEKEEYLIPHFLEAVLSLIKKMYSRDEESKLLSLLHIFSENIIMAPHVPLALLQKAYSTVQALLLLPLPTCAAAKEVLDLIQVEMKSPGYFRRTIYLQEHEAQINNQASNVQFPGTPTNLFIDKGKGNWDTIETALGNLTRKTNGMSTNENLHRSLMIELIFHSVFGSSCCDVPMLRKAIQVCSEAQLSRIYNESLSIMEHSVGMESTTAAQDYVKKHLEALSTAFAATDQEYGENPAKLQETSENQEQDRNHFPVALSRSAPSLLSLIAPPRNNSYLSRTASVDPNLSTPSTDQRNRKEPSAAEKINYAQIVLKSFDKNQLADAIFELVRLTAKEFVVEKRKSSSGYSTAQKRYLDKKRSSLKSSGSVRDSGLIEDYSGGDKTSPGKSPRKTPTKRYLTSPENSPAKPHQEETPKIDSTFKSSDKLPMHSSTEALAKATDESREEFWKKFSESGFITPATKEDEESLEKLLNSFRYSGHLSDDEKKELEDVKRRSGNSRAHKQSAIRRSKSSVSEFPSMKNNLKPPLEPKDSIPVVALPEKPSTSRSKKAKRRFLTIGRKGMKMVRGIRRSSSARAVDLESAEAFPSEEPHETFKSLLESEAPAEEKNLHSGNKPISANTVSYASNNFFDGLTTPRWRTTSLPHKESLRGKKKGKQKRGNIMQLFPSSGDIRLESQENNSSSNSKKNKQSRRRYSSSTKDGDLSLGDSKSCSYDGLDMDKLNPLKEMDSYMRSQSNSALLSRNLSLDDRLHTFADDDESRSRMDSGITADKSSDDASLASPGANRGDRWEETGVAGVKFIRRQCLRRTRSRRTSLSHQIQDRMTKKKVLKLAFIGNDATVGDVARAYYELRRRQLTRAPLLHHIDLRLYYIPVGENTFSNECGSNHNGCGTFDLEIGEMLGEADPWYRSVVTGSLNNLLRVLPQINNEEIEDKLAESDNKTPCNSLPTPDQLTASTILNYFRFAIKTCHVPIFKATMRTSSDEVITEVFCCRAEIGYLAYKQAIAAGRFGKMGKLVDLSNDTGPPVAYTLFKYKKFGINGRFAASKTQEEINYYRVCFLPIALSESHREQARFSAADGLHVTLVDNDKRIKLLKRGTKISSSEEDSSKLCFTVSEAKLEVVRPLQGTFTVCLDNNLIHTNIKSFEVSRCMAPEHDRPSSRKRKQSNSGNRVMSLPLKTFWPNL